MNASGFPIQRAKIAASFGTVEFTIPQMKIAASVKGGEVTKLIGGNPVRACAECQKRAAVRASASPDLATQVASLAANVKLIEMRTRHLVPAEAAVMLERIAASTNGR